jgi:hypothetical protein
MMNTKIKILMAAGLISFAACEKVIIVDLNSASPKVVVEGNITNETGPYTIKLSSTANYYQPNVFPPVTGATVVVSDDAGNSETLTEVIPGSYQTAHLQGVPGRTYTLNINSNGNIFTASSTMPTPVPIDSVNFVLSTRNQTYRVVCKFKDPAGIANYYKLQINSNDTLGFDTTSVRILKDGLADGQELSITYRTHLLLGDSVIVKLECIDYNTYEFYSTLPNVGGGLGSILAAPPANPINNISNGGFGYFAAYSISRDTTTVH